MAFPVVEATATDSFKSKTPNVNLPTGITSGDLLVMFIGGRDDVGTGGIGWPAGWTELMDDLDTGNPRAAVAYRIADGTEGSSIGITMSSDRDLVSYCYRISGTSGNAPEIADATGTSSSPNPPNLTPTWGSKDTLWLVYGSCDDGRAFTAAPTNYTDFTAQDRSQASTGTARRELAATSENPGSFTIDQSEPWQAVTVAVEPAGGGTDTPVNMDAGSFTQTGQTATVTLNIAVDPTVGSYAFSGLDNVVNQALTASMDAGSYALSSLSAVVSRDVAVSADAGSYTFAGEDSSVLLSVSPGVGSYTFTGHDATVSTAGTTPVLMDAGSFTVSGLDATITTSIGYDMDAGSFALSGHDLTVTTGLDIDMDAGSFALSGHASALSINRAIVTDAGSYVFAGHAATIVADGQSAARVVDAFNPEDNTVTLSQANSVSVGGNNSVTVNTKNNG